MIASSCLTATGVSLMYTFSPASNQPYWIGYQALAGIGYGLGMQQPLRAIQVVLELSYISTGLSVILFLQTLGGALFVSVSQKVLYHKLVEQLKLHVPEIDPLIVLNAGVTASRKAVDKAALPGIKLAYNNALTEVFLVAGIMAALAILGSLVIEWKPVKAKHSEARDGERSAVGDMVEIK